MRTEYEFWAQVDSICDQFEQAWRKDHSARVEAFLNRLADDPKAHLLAKELLTLERELRETAGESVVAEEYSRRFPEWTDLLHELFNDGGSVPQGGSVPNGDASTVSVTRERGHVDGPRPEGYELQEEIAAGGMGAIHRARDLRLERDVAVKLIRPCYESYRAVRERFNFEAKITGQLQHPGIPPVHDLGVLPDGRPYLAMKLIHGQTLGELLKSRPPELPADHSHHVRVFEQVCQAVGYAHANGVIHRDLKPANIMVGEFGEVHVMDWGLAKVIGAQADRLDTAIVALPEGAETQAGDAMGTLQYMAPEQAAGRLSEMDARTDVFGLGAILCEILTGSPPIQGGTIEELKARAESSELGDNVKALQAAAREPANGSVTPELAALCVRCLQPDPQRRFESGGAVAEEVSRIHLAMEERARRAELERSEALVRERESVKRRRVWAYATSIVVTALTIGVVGTTWSALYANRQKTLARQAYAAEAKQALAERRAKENEQSARAKAEQRLEQIEKSNSILGDVFQDLNVRQNGLGDIPVQEVLAQRLVVAAQQIDEEAIGDPMTVATMQNRLGMTLVTLDRFKEAISLFEKAHATCLESLGPQHQETTTVARNLAVALHFDHQWQRAAERLREVLANQENAPGADPIRIAQTMESLATALTYLGRHAEAIERFERAIEIQAAKLGDDDHAVLLARVNLAGAHRENGDWAMSLEQLRMLQPAIIETLGERHPDVAGFTKELAVAHLRVGEYEEAAELAGRALALATEKLGPSHSVTIHCRFTLGSALLASNHIQQAMPELQASWELMRERLGDARYETAVCMCELGTAYLKAGRKEEAKQMVVDAVERLGQLIGPEHPTTLYNTRQLARVHVELGEWNVALPLMQGVARTSQKRLGDDHPISLLARNDVAYILQAVGQIRDAIAIWEDVGPRMKTALGASHRDTLTAAHNLAAAYRVTGQLDRALPMLEANYQARAAALGEDDVDTLTSLNELGVCYWATGQYDKSVRAFEDVLPKMEERHTRHHRDTLLVIANLGLNYLAAGRVEDAVPLLEEATNATDTNQEMYLYLESLIDAYRRTGSPKVRQAVKKLLTWAKPQLAAQPVVWSGMLAKCGDALLKVEAFDEAAPLLEECLEIRKKVAPTFWLTYNSMSLVGAAYLGQGQFEKAEPLLVQGYQGLKDNESSIPEGAKERLPEAVQRLLDLARARNREQDIEKWEGMLEDVRRK